LLGSSKNILILGGTGTLGRALISKIEEIHPEWHITVFSRDEHKQAELKRSHRNVTCVLGDIRTESVYKVFRGKDIVFHVAALKHIDILEDNPWESVLTNIVATKVVADAAVSYGVKNFIFSSTDKAVDPVNVYGACKFISEKYLFHLNKAQQGTKFAVYRWGNVLGSNGSVIPQFIKTLLNEQKIYITSPLMTRFWIPIEWAVQYMLRTYGESRPFSAMIPPTMKAATVPMVGRCVAQILGVKDFKTEIIGLRAGEKHHEALSSQHEDNIRSDNVQMYTMDELTDLLTPIVKDLYDCSSRGKRLNGAKVSSPLKLVES